MSVATLGKVVLYTPRQIFVASFLGSPAAAAWFMALNHRALLQSGKEQQILILGGIATIAVTIVAFLLPGRTPDVAWSLAYSFAIYVFAQSRFGPSVENHLSAGGQRGSWWRLVWVSLLFLVGVFVLLLAFFLLFSSLFE